MSRWNRLDNVLKQIERSMGKGAKEGTKWKGKGKGTGRDIPKPQPNPGATCKCCGSPNT